MKDGIHVRVRMRFYQVQRKSNVGGLEFHQHRQTSYRCPDRVATTSGARLGSRARVCIRSRGRFLRSCTPADSVLKRVVRFPRRGGRRQFIQNQVP